MLICSRIGTTPPGINYFTFITKDKAYHYISNTWPSVITLEGGDGLKRAFETVKPSTAWSVFL